MILIIGLPIAMAVETRITEPVQDTAEKAAEAATEAATTVVQQALPEQLTFQPDTVREYETGEAIIVNIKDYQPKIVQSGLIENDDIPVFVFLKGTTLGTLLGGAARSITTEPFYGDPEIRQVLVRPADPKTLEYVVGTPRYVRPATYSLENLGYLTILLKRIEKEADVPSEIVLNMTAEIWFENAERLYNMFQQDLVLPLDADEQAWRNKDLREYSFFSNRGFLRAHRIDANSVSFVYYSGLDLVPPYTGSPRPIRDFTLTSGTTSDFMELRDTVGLMQNQFRVKLNRILDSSVKRAKVELNIDGRYQTITVTEGSSLYPGSAWNVLRINEVVTDNVQKQEVVIRSTNDQKTLTREISGSVLSDQNPCADFRLLLSQALSLSADPSKVMASLNLPSTIDFNDLLDVTKLNQTLDSIVYCKAIEQYKKIIDNYPTDVSKEGPLFSDKAAFRVAKIYERLGNPFFAKRYYEIAVRNNRGDFIAEANSRINSLEREIEQNALYRSVDFIDNGVPVNARIVEIVGGGEEDKPSVLIDVGNEGTKELKLGDYIFRNDIVEAGRNYNWRITDIKDDFINLEKRQRTPDTAVTVQLVTTRETAIVRKGVTSTIEGQAIVLRDTNIKKYAHVTIIPGTGQPLQSKSNFLVTIPIEKRALDLNPNKTQSRIDKTERLISRLDSVIDSLDNIITVWKKVCLFTFLFLTVKNSFFTGLSRTQARNLVMRGADGKGGWYAYCQANSGRNKVYDSFDKCISSNNNQIERTISESQSAIERVNNEMKNYQNQDWFKDLSQKYDGLDKFEKYVAGDLFDKEALRDYRYWQLMKESSSYNLLQGQQVGTTTTFNFKSEVDKNLKDFEITSLKAEAFSEAVKIVNEKYENFDQLPDDKKKEIFNDLFSATQQSPTLRSAKFPLVNLFEITTLATLRKTGNKFYSNSNQGTVELEPATVRDYIVKLNQRLATATETQKAAINVELQRVQKEHARDMNSPLTTNEGQVYKDGQNNLYIAISQSFSAGETRTDYSASANIEVYPDGRPYCVPTCQNGNYVKVLDFYADGSAKTIQEWNVGNDGLLCTNDDVLVTHNSILDLPQNEARYRSLINIVNRVGNRKKGESVSLCGRTFAIDDSRVRVEGEVSSPSCYDVIDPSDCETLFGVCDPVMCPPSRFDLGGRYKVENVVQSGIVGSLVLGLHNFGPKQPVPVCLTGIDAGLKNIRSILQGYADCLRTSLVQGKSVGICDKIRSVYICEMLWREAANIFKIKGSIFDWLSEKVFGQKRTGGEYLTFQSSLQNLQNSVNFFTQEYASTAFAAFNARSMDEIGVTICRARLFGKLPAFGEMVNQIATPENPPQYTAMLSSAPYAESATLQLAQYEVFYHIYAGTTPEETIEGLFTQPTTGLRHITYSVFLKNPANDKYYVTERCQGIRSEIPYGDIASRNLNCVAPQGFNEVCVEINGNINCGFGSVSSAFSLNYLNDLIIKDEMDKEIRTEEQCVPSAPRTSPSLGSFILPGTIGILETGMRRVCSIENPGQGTNPNNFKVVGSCGTDAMGRSLGSCWLDLSTLALQDIEARENLLEQLNQQTLKEEKERAGVIDILTEEAAEKELALVKEISRTTCNIKIEVVKKLMDIERRSLSTKIAAEAQLLLGMVVEELAEACSLKDPTASIKLILFNYNQKVDENLNNFEKEAEKLRLEIRVEAELRKQLEELVKKHTDELNNLKNQYSTEALNEIRRLNIDGAQEALNVELENVQKRINTKLEEVVSKVLGSITELSPAEKIREQTRCNECGVTSAILRVEECKKDMCHALGDCYYVPDTGVVSGVLSFTGIKDSGQCNACAMATKCSDFDTDLDMCNNPRCNTVARLNCEVKDGKCVSKTAPVPPAPTVQPPDVVGDVVGTITGNFAVYNALLANLNYEYSSFAGTFSPGSSNYAQNVVNMRDTGVMAVANRRQLGALISQQPPTFVPTTNPTFDTGRIRYTTYYTPNCADYPGGRNDPNFLSDWRMQGAAVCEGVCYGTRDGGSVYDCSTHPMGSTSTGIPRVRGLIAVNPTRNHECYIPYGSMVYINFDEARNSGLNGWYLAADTGGEVIQTQCRIDIFVGGRTEYNRLMVNTNNAKAWVFPLTQKTTTTPPLAPITGALNCPPIERVFNERSFNMFNQVYGEVVGQGTSANNNAVRPHIKTMNFLGYSIQIHEKLENVFKCVEQEIRNCPETYPLTRASTIRYSNSVSTISRHMWGIAFDYNPAENPYCNEPIMRLCGLCCVPGQNTCPSDQFIGNEPLDVYCNRKIRCCNTNERARYRLPDCYVNAFKKFGFRWGGDWEWKDYMHFEFHGNPDNLPANFGEPIRT